MLSCLNIGSIDASGHQRHSWRLTGIRESLRRTKSSWSCLWTWAPPQPRRLRVEECLIILRQLSPALSLCRDTCLWVSAYVLDPTSTHFIKLQLGPNTDVFCNYAFFKNGVKVCDNS